MKKILVVAIALIAGFYSQAQEFVYSEVIMMDPVSGTTSLKTSGRISIQDSSITETVEGIKGTWKPTSIQKEGSAMIYTYESISYTRRLQLAAITEELKPLLETIKTGKKKDKSQFSEYSHVAIDVNKDKLTGSVTSMYTFLTIQK